MLHSFQRESINELSSRRRKQSRKLQTKYSSEIRSSEWSNSAITDNEYFQESRVSKLENITMKRQVTPNFFAKYLHRGESNLTDLNCELNNDNTCKLIEDFLKGMLGTHLEEASSIEDKILSPDTLKSTPLISTSIKNSESILGDAPISPRILDTTLNTPDSILGNAPILPDSTSNTPDSILGNAPILPNTTLNTPDSILGNAPILPDTTLNTPDSILGDAPILPDIILDTSDSILGDTPETLAPVSFFGAFPTKQQLRDYEKDHYRQRIIDFLNEEWDTALLEEVVNSE